MYCGTIMTDEGKEKKVTIDFEPFKPINTSLYLCDNKFHTEALSDLLTDDNCFGFIVMDGNGCLFGTLTGNTRDIITKVSLETIFDFEVLYLIFKFSSLSICQRSTVVVVNLRCVLPVCEWRSVTTMFERLPRPPSSASSKTTKLPVPILSSPVPPISKPSSTDPTCLISVFRYFFEFRLRL